jgi:hypothetical protein
MAKLVAGQLSEAEAATRLGINPATWYSFKSRCKREGKFMDARLRYDAERNERLLEGIEKAGEDCEIQVGDKKVITKRGDWRAKAWLLGTSHPKRFSDAAARVTIETGPQQPIHVHLATMLAAVRQVYAQPEPAQIADVPASEPRQLQAPQEAEPIAVDAVTFTGPRQPVPKLPRMFKDKP